MCVCVGGGGGGGEGGNSSLGPENANIVLALASQKYTRFVSEIPLPKTRSKQFIAIYFSLVVMSVSCSNKIVITVIEIFPYPNWAFSASKSWGGAESAIPL